MKKQQNKEDTMVQNARDDLRSNAVQEIDHAGLKEAAAQSAKLKSRVGQQFSRPWRRFSRLLEEFEDMLFGG